MLKSVLIANRGEIACRIIKTARRLGIRAIAVYSEADVGALFVRMADEAYAIGPAPARESYLVAEKIIQAAKASGAEAIHPGYGFLSENANFAEQVKKAGLIFVGPPASAIRAMGLKDAAKALVEKAGVPVVPGYHGTKQDPAFLRDRAVNVGFPVLIKAVAGGGGKGMRRVDRLVDFEEALASAQREAQSAFGEPRVLVEKYVRAPRHVEIQIFADRHGHAVSLFERDCSLQRRHQKVIEEAPAPGMTPDMRHAMGRAAVEAAKAVGYVGAGTVEFIADSSQGLNPDGFYFMEMNTRLQVEHPVTEAITGLDLVELQFRVASGEPLPFTQADLTINGHAVEARLYAEDPERDFLPSTGKLFGLSFPEGPGIRVDTGVEQGDRVTPFYDPMIAKIIAHGANRIEALDRLATALDSTTVIGPRSNARFLAALCRAEAFRSGAFDTGFIERNLEALGAVPAAIDGLAVARGARLLIEAEGMRALPHRDGPPSPWDVADAFQLSGLRHLTVPILADEVTTQVIARWSSDGLVVEGPDGAVDDGQAAMTVWPSPQGIFVVHQGRQTLVRLPELSDDAEAHGGGDGAVKAPMHGRVIAVLVDVGDRVTRGQKIAVMEAMKMEQGLVAPRDGVVEDIAVDIGQQVSQGARLISIGEPEPVK
jgi:3-methylcrotonyl-CoA carboxylase alpha subunit